MVSDDDDYPDAALDSEKSLNADQRRALVNASVDTLDLAQAALVPAIYREGLSYSQLAARAVLPVTTVKSKVRRALSGVRAQLEDRTQTPSRFLTWFWLPVCSYVHAYCLRTIGAACKLRFPSQ